MLQYSQLSFIHTTHHSALFFPLLNNRIKVFSVVDQTNTKMLPILFHNWPVCIGQTRNTHVFQNEGTDHVFISTKFYFKLQIKSMKRNTPEKSNVSWFFKINFAVVPVAKRDTGLISA